MIEQDALRVVIPRLAMPNHLSELLSTHAAARGDEAAVHFPQKGGGWRAITFGEIDRDADRIASGLRAAGFRPGDRTLLMVRPDHNFYALAFGMFRAGVIPVFIDPGMGMKKALRCVETIAPTGLAAVPPVHIVSTFLRKPFKSVRTRLSAGFAGWWGDTTLAKCLATEPDGTPVSGGLDDDAVIVFTSGSTGPAKGVSMTHRCMIARVEAIQDLFSLEPGSTIVETLLVYTMLEVCMGLTVVIPHMDLAKPAKVDPANVVAAVEAFSPRYASASPVVWQRLVRHCEGAGVRLPTLELLLTTAAPIPVDLHTRLSRVVPETTELFTPYGATEAMPVSRIGSAEILEVTAARTASGEGTCVGMLADCMDVRIIRVSDAPIATWADAHVLGEGELGEIVVRGDGVSQTYRAAPEGNAKAKITDGDTIWHRMGDLGRIDADGRLWFCGRKTHRLETADGVVPAVCVEGVFNAHASVYRTAVVGVGPSGQQRPVLCVELEPGKTWSSALEAEILALAVGTRWDGLIETALPHPGFPTDARHNSKIRREDLREWAATQRVPAVA
jgi:acyl-CoA synthetase (AMP-forming)/AMP-acid ligase II